MQLNPILNSAVQSMTANQLALAVAANNIANASNPDYSRQRLVTRPAGPDGSKWGVGMGVQLVGIEAMRDMLIERRLRQEISLKSGADTLANRLTGVESVFNDSDGSGLLQVITNFFNSFQTLSQDPSSLPAREQVKATAGLLVDSLHTRSIDLATVKSAANQAVTADIGEVNRLTAEIAEVTGRITIDEVTAPANDLRDHRSALVKELAQYVTVNELETDDYQLTTTNGTLLVLNTFAKALPPSVAANIGDGALSGEIEVRDTYMPKYQAALDQIAYEIQQHVNSIHSAGYDLDGNTSIDFFTPLGAATGAARSIALSSDVEGDVRKIAASQSATGADNNGAIAMANLLYAPVFSGGSITDQYSTLVFNVGADVAGSKSQMNEHEILLTQLRNRRQSVSGVSIDEESMQILQFQRSYQASARLIQTVDELIQTALAMGR